MYFYFKLGQVPTQLSEKMLQYIFLMLLSCLNFYASCLFQNEILYHALLIVFLNYQKSLQKKQNILDTIPKTEEYIVM